MGESVGSKEPIASDESLSDADDSLSDADDSLSDADDSLSDADDSFSDMGPLSVPRRVYDFIKRVVVAYIRDDVPLYSAAIAFYALLSLAPILVLAIAMADAVAAGEVVRHDMSEWISQRVSADVAALLDEWTHVQHSGDSTISVYVSVIVLVVSASRLFQHVQTALDRIWHIKSESEGNVLSALWARIWGLGIIGIIGISLILGVAVKVVIRAMAIYINADGVPFLWVLLDWSIYFVLVGGLVYVTYRRLPNVLVHWQHALIGAAITAVLLIIGGEIIAYYVAIGGVTTSFGAAGSVMALVLWVYYASQVFLIGAVITWLFAEKGARVRKRPRIRLRRGRRKPSHKDGGAHPKKQVSQGESI
ncbi:MAG: membrane protein [Polyangiales bacterium]|jgi:membrane protein